MEGIKLKKIDGFKIANEIQINFVKKISILKQDYNIIPNIRIILIGENPASLVYVNRKISIAKNLGISAEIEKLDSNISQLELLKIIQKINNDKSIHGIIIQLPLPNHINKDEILLEIDPKKDLDGLHPMNIGLLNSFNKQMPYSINEILNNNIESQITLAKNLGISIPFIPCTPLGCIYLINSVKTDLSGLNAVVFGNSNLVGKPISRLLLLNNCSVTILHSKSKNYSHYIQNADIIICATGSKKELFSKNDIKENVILIDVGINFDQDKKIHGDINFVDFLDKNCYLTPVPGGVGPMTVISLMINSYISCLKNI